MLILTRKVGETLMIGDNISITIVGAKGNQINIGIDAPKDVPIHREEVYQRIKPKSGSEDTDGTDTPDDAAD